MVSPRLINHSDTDLGVRTVLFGDSLTFLSNHIDTSTGATFVYDDATGESWYEGGGFATSTDYGAFAWADALMMAPLYIVKNSGIGGNNTDQMLARLSADVLQYQPELVVMWGGRNDFKQGRDSPYVSARITQILDQITAIGARILIIDVPPSADLHTVASASRNAAFHSEWLRDEVRKRKNCQLVSALAVMADPLASAGAAAKSTYVLVDTTHNNNLGAFRVGEAIARVLGPQIKPWARYPLTPVEGWDFVASDASEIRNSNPLVAGSGGTAGTGASGTVAAGYEVQRFGGTGTAVCSVVEDVEYVGNAQRLAMTFGAANDGFSFGVSTGNINTRFVTGKLMEMQVDLLFSADSAAVINRMECYAGGTFGGNTRSIGGLRRVTSSLVQGVADNIQPLPLAGKRLRIRTPRLKITDASSTLWQHFVRFAASGAGTVTVDISRYSVRLYSPQ